MQILLEKPPDYWDKQPKAVGIPRFQDAGWTKTRGTVGAMKPGPVKASGSGETTQGWGGWVGKKADCGPEGGKDGCAACEPMGVGTGPPVGRHKPQSEGNGPFG